MIISKCQHLSADFSQVSFRRLSQRMIRYFSNLSLVIKDHMQILDDDSKCSEPEKLDEESRKNYITEKFRKHTLNLADYKNFCDYI